MPWSELMNSAPLMFSLALRGLFYCGKEKFEMEYFDNVLQQMVEAHEEVTPETGKYINLDDPETFKDIFVKETEAE